MNWIEDCISQYYDWLKNNTFINTNMDSEWVSVTTPFLGLYNDPIEIYIKRENDKYILSDDGATIKGLDLLGANISHSPKRKEWLSYVLQNYGIKLDGCNELTVNADNTNFAQKKHGLISAIAEISDMEVTAKHMVSSLFKDDVKQLLDEQNLIYTPQFITKGSTGLEFTFDFQIAGRTKEMMIKSFNSLNKINVPNFLFSLEDIRPIRERNSGKELLSLAIVNDEDKEIKPEYIMALQSKDTDVIYWSQRNKPENLEKLHSIA